MPPLATASVPASVIVPAAVIGLPETVRPVEPPENATLVTVPGDPVAVHEQTEPSVVNTFPALLV